MAVSVLAVVVGVVAGSCVVIRALRSGQGATHPVPAGQVREFPCRQGDSQRTSPLAQMECCGLPERALLALGA